MKMIIRGAEADQRNTREQDDPRVSKISRAILQAEFSGREYRRLEKQDWRRRQENWERQKEHACRQSCDNSKAGGAERITKREPMTRILSGA